MDHQAFHRDLRESRKTLEALKAISGTAPLTVANIAQLCEEMIKNNKRVELILLELERMESD